MCYSSKSQLCLMCDECARAEVSFILAPSSVADLVALLPFYVADLDMETPLPRPRRTNTTHDV